MLQRTTVVTALACFLTLMWHTASAQSPADGAARAKRPTSPAAKASPAPGGPDSLAEAERATALALVISLAGEARDYHDPVLRVLIIARAADALWESDRGQARTLFYRAWEAAEGVDKEGLRNAEETRKAFLAGRRRGPNMIPPAPNLRAEVLKLASQRSRELGEEFIEKLNDAQEEDKGVSSPSISDPTEPSNVIAGRLELARQLLEGGDAKRALLFARPALEFTTSPGIIFLSALRRKDPALADGLYVALLQRAATDPTADATTVSLLSAYAYSPSVLVTATQNGRLSNQWADPLPAPSLSTDLHTAFFRVAAGILLRPLPPPDQDRTSAGRAGTYFTITRLLPLFERYAPEQVPALKALLTTLTRDVPANYQADQEGMLTLGLAPAGDGVDDVQDPLRNLSSTAGVAKRDAAYARAARIAALRGDVRAREYAEKVVENDSLKTRVLAFVDFALLRDAVSKRKLEEALKLIRAEGLEPLQRVWGYTELARVSKRTSPARASELLEAAVTEAQRIDEETPERAYAFIAIAARLIEIDRARGWQIITEAIKTANRIKGFKGDEGKVEARLDTSDNTTRLKADASGLNLDGVFAALASDDLQRAAALANTLTGEYPRAISTLAAARTVLNRK